MNGRYNRDTTLWEGQAFTQGFANFCVTTVQLGCTFKRLQASAVPSVQAMLN